MLMEGAGLREEAGPPLEGVFPQEEVEAEQSQGVAGRGRSFGRHGGRGRRGRRRGLGGARGEELHLQHQLEGPG